jgi:carbonic anhydrase/acetyltransferase-like protein (isoleucine patch superfamily)
MKPNVTPAAALAVLLATPHLSKAAEWTEYENPGTGGLTTWSAYRTDPRVESRRSEHFLIRYGNQRQEGILVEQIAVGHLQYLENCYDTWRALGFTPALGGTGEKKYRSVLHVAKTFPDDPTGPVGATGFGEGDASGRASGCCVPTSYLGYREGNGTTPHEFGHGWGTRLPSVFSESEANWIQQLALVDYPHDWCNVGMTMGHKAHLYNNLSIFNHFMEAPGYGAPFLMKLFYEPNLNASDPALDDIIRKAIRCDTSGAADKAGAIHDELGMMCARMLDMDFWNRRVNGLDRSTMRRATAYDNDANRPFFHYNRIPMVRQPGVGGAWFRPEFSMIPQSLSQNFIPLDITANGSPRTIACDFRPVPDAIRGTSFRACFVAFGAAKQARYSALWNAGQKSFTLADDEHAVYLAIIACPSRLNPDLTHNDYTSDNVAMFPYRLSLTNASPKGWRWPAPAAGSFTLHVNGGGKVANTATVDATAYVGPDAMVLGSAKVHGRARIEDHAMVDGEAVVGRAPGSTDDPVVSGHAHVTDKAQVHGHAKVRDYAWVAGTSTVADNAIVMAHSRLDGARVSGNAVLNSTAVRDPSLSYRGAISGYAILGGDTSGDAPMDKGVYCEYPGLSVLDNKHQYLGYNFEKASCVFAMDQHGMNHSYLMGEPQVVADTVHGVATKVLNLDGSSQYVELRPDAADFADLTIAAWVKWTGTQANQMIWSFGDGENKLMGLTPKGSAGKLRFAIGNGSASHHLDGPAALAPGVWTHVAVTISANTATLYVNGVQVAQDADITIRPDQLHAPLMENANFIGRGESGNHFSGRIDEFKVLNKALDAAEVLDLMANVTAGAAGAADTTPPTPAVAGWLVAPTVTGHRAITMSATEGNDAEGNGVLYYFRCVNDASHDSGWISENKYTDSNCAGGRSYTYTVRMKDAKGNAGRESEPMSTTTPPADKAAPTPNPPTFASAPTGTGTTAISMTATKGADDDETILYKFTRVGSPAATSGWTGNPAWTDTGLTPGAACAYTLQMKDGQGNITSITTSAQATARDDTAPALDADFRMQWHILPHTQLDKSVRMMAREQLEADVEYYFECVEQPSVNSGWTGTRTWITSSFAKDGTYSFRFKLRDKSPNRNQSPWSAVKAAKVLPTNSYHDHALAGLAALPDSTLVRFSGKVAKVNPGDYVIRSADGTASITVVPRTYNNVTDATLLGRTVEVKGHLWTYAGTPKRVTSGIVRSTPQSGKVELENCEYTDEHFSALRTAEDASGREYLGGFPRGYAVTIPHVAATSQMTVNYRKGGTVSLYVNHAHAMDLNLPDQKDWGPAVFTGLGIPAGANLRLQRDEGDGEPDLDSVIVGPVFPVSGAVAGSKGGAGIAGATVYFSDIPDASANRHAAIVTTDASGNYQHTLRDGTWYVCAAKDGYNTSADQTVVINGAAQANIRFTLVPNVEVAGKVTGGNGRTALSGASVHFAPTPGGAAVFTARTSATGGYTQALPNGTWHVQVGKPGCYPSPERKLVVSGAARTGLDFTLESDPQALPQPENLYFHVTPDSFTAADGQVTGNWQLQYLDGKNVSADAAKFAVPGGSPSMELRGARKWVRIKYDDMEGYEVQNRTLTPILPFNGGTFVAVIKPTLLGRVAHGCGGQYIVNVGYTGPNGFSLVMMNDTGQLKVRRQGMDYMTGVFIPDGQETVLCCVVQPDGSFKLFANGAMVYAQSETRPFANLDLSAHADHQKKVTIGEGIIWLDGSDSFHGAIGDVLVYHVPLADADRSRLESHLMKKFAIPGKLPPATR